MAMTTTPRPEISGLRQRKPTPTAAKTTQISPMYRPTAVRRILACKEI